MMLTVLTEMEDGDGVLADSNFLVRILGILGILHGCSHFLVPCSKGQVRWKVVTLSTPYSVPSVSLYCRCYPPLDHWTGLGAELEGTFHRTFLM